MPDIDASPVRFALLIGLAFFLGLAFEEGYREGVPRPPGGIRTFPMLALAGAAAYLIEPRYALVFAVGLGALGAWLFAFYRARLARDKGRDEPGSGLVTHACNVLAYALGPIVLTQPSWMAIGITVTTVLFLGARQRLHHFARRVPSQEIATAGQFLILAGIILPLLPDRPIVDITPLTPYKAWLAVVAVSALSYASYLLERYVSQRRGIMATAIIGGAYSSTSVTVALVRRLARDGAQRRICEAGIIASSTVMFVRMIVVAAVFDHQLALALLPMLAPLFLLGAAIAFLLARQGSNTSPSDEPPLRNPLELSAALMFATLFVAVSLAVGWLKTRYGVSGIFGLAALSGVVDVDPLVLSLAQSPPIDVGRASEVAAILIAASANNLAKAGYAFAFGGPARPVASPVGLAVLGAGGFALAPFALRLLG